MEMRHVPGRNICAAILYDWVLRSFFTSLALTFPGVSVANPRFFATASMRKLEVAEVHMRTFTIDDSIDPVC